MVAIITERRGMNREDAKSAKDNLALFASSRLLILDTAAAREDPSRAAVTR